MMTFTPARLVTAFLMLGLATAPARADDQSPPARPAATRPRPRVEPAHRVFISLNGGWQSSSLTFKDTGSKPVFQENVTWTVDYEVKGGPILDVSGGVRVWRNLFASTTYTRFSDSSVAAVTGLVPHPFFFNQPRSIGGDSSSLSHLEQGLHMSAAWIVPGRHLEVAVFGGPSLFFVRRDLVSDIQYSEQGYPYDVAVYNGTLVTSVKDTVFGGHVGVDVAWYFSRSVGVGGVVRFSRGKAELPNAAGSGTLPLNVGGFQVAAGLRLRLGPASPQKARPAAPRRSSEPAGAVKQPPTAASARMSAVTIKDTPVFINPDAQQPLRTLPSGTTVTVIEDRGEWLKVEFSDRQWGTRRGYVLSANCRR